MVIAAIGAVYYFASRGEIDRALHDEQTPSEGPTPEVSPV
jgi:hypothetical protein